MAGATTASRVALSESDLLSGRILPDPEEREVHSPTPEERREEARRRRVPVPRGIAAITWAVVKRTLVGTYNDGFIHAGNLAYLAMFSIFPFFILGAAVFSLMGEETDRAALINAVLLAMPPVVGNVIEPVARDVVAARSGWWLWVGGLVALWTVSSLIETIRDILRRAYGTKMTHAFWTYRLLSAGLSIGAVVLLMLSLISQVVIGTARQIIEVYFPTLVDTISTLEVTRIVPVFGLYASLYLLFYTLTPKKYRSRRYPKWPGVMLTTAWWVAVTSLLPPLLRSFFSYDMTYGSMAGIMIALFFFWLVGLGVVLGAEFNAALAETPEEEMNILGQADDRARRETKRAAGVALQSEQE